MSSSAVAEPGVGFDHLMRLSDGGGLFEHARFTDPRPEHGYCVDDIARGLVVIARETTAPPALQELADLYLWLVVDAQRPDGRFHNRRDTRSRWTDHASLEDCWGRALWGLGTVAGRLPEDDERVRVALAAFNRGARRRSPHLRAGVFAALGAAEVLRRWPGQPAARSLLEVTAAEIVRHCPSDAAWPWPEPRLRYANASVPEVLLAAGSLLGSDRLLERGLALLGWLLEIESSGDRLSVTPVGGWVPGEPRPGFDQQPIEVAALADACARAWELTGDEHWWHGLQRCRAWFLGANDSGVMLLDVTSGGGCDGLLRDGRNENQGAESTMALISTFQRCSAVAAPLHLPPQAR